jgi:hypothetical protein
MMAQLDPLDEFVAIYQQMKAVHWRWWPASLSCGLNSGQNRADCSPRSDKRS